MNGAAHPAAIRDRARRRAGSITRSGRVDRVFDSARALSGIRGLGFEASGPIELIEYGILDQRGIRTIVFRLNERCPCRGEVAAYDVATVTVSLTVRPGCSRAQQREGATDGFIDAFRRHRDADELAARGAISR